MPDMELVAQRAKILAVLDKVRRDHYGDMPLNDEERKQANHLVERMLDEIKNLKHPAVKAFGEAYNEFLLGDQAVLNRLMLIAAGCKKINGGNEEACRLEREALAYELVEILDAPSHGPCGTGKTQEQVCAAVSEKFTGYQKKGLLRQSAMEKAIEDNIADIVALDLWRTNRGKPDEGEPGSSWKACYQRLYDKGYLKRKK